MIGQGAEPQDVQAIAVVVLAMILLALMLGGGSRED